MLVQACLNAGNDKAILNPRMGAVKLVQACLSARKYRQSSIHHCGVPVKFV